MSSELLWGFVSANSRNKLSTISITYVSNNPFQFEIAFWLFSSLSLLFICGRSLLSNTDPRLAGAGDAAGVLIEPASDLRTSEVRNICYRLRQNLREDEHCCGTEQTLAA